MNEWGQFIELLWSKQKWDMSAQDVVEARFLLPGDSGGHDVGFRKLSGVGTHLKFYLKEVCKRLNSFSSC